jgi:hypothetical protein
MSCTDNVQVKREYRRRDTVNYAADLTTYDESLFQNPEFEHHEATSNIQLFFDLFFVANLTSFTNAHEINSLSSMCVSRVVVAKRRRAQAE